MSEVGERLRRLRLAAGFSQRELSERAGVHHSRVSRIEAGWVECPDAQTRHALASVLRCDPSAFCPVTRVPTGHQLRDVLRQYPIVATLLAHLATRPLAERDCEALGAVVRQIVGGQETPGP